MSSLETRSGGNATGLPGAKPFGTLSRRAAMVGALTVGSLKASGRLPAFAHPEPTSPDATLIDLGRRLEALISAERTAWDRHAAAEDAAFVESPPAPVCRKVTNPFDAGDSMTAVERIALYIGPNPYREDCLAAEAEHHATMAEHARVVVTIEKKHGVDCLARQARRLSNEVAAASARLAEMPASTPAGVSAKARALLPFTGADLVSRPVEFESHLTLLVSTLEDAARLGVGALS